MRTEEEIKLRMGVMEGELNKELSPIHELVIKNVIDEIKWVLNEDS